MLIRTIDELEALPEGAVVRECDSNLRTWVFEKGADDDWLLAGEDIRRGANEIILPAQLLHPRRFGDDDVKAVARALYGKADPRHGRNLTDLARAVLEALEGDGQ